MKEKLTVSAKQIEWCDYKAKLYTKSTGFLGDKTVVEIMLFEDEEYPWVTSHHTAIGFECAGTYYDTLDQAKQACQAHLQQYVDGLLLQLQQLTEIENED